jgi:hypothetical protein
VPHFAEGFVGSTQALQQTKVHEVRGKEELSMTPNTAAVKLQSLYRGVRLRRENVCEALRERRAELEEVLSSADAETERFEPWVFDEKLEAKQLQGVPVPLIEYEEKLLRLQLKLDGLQSSGPASDIMRQWRRQVNTKLQQRLQRLDVCREGWRVKHAAAAVA